MDMERESNGFFKGFLIGSAIGAGLGLLFAPMPGIETRARIRDMAGQARGQASTVPTSVQGTVQSAAEKSRSYLQGVRDRLAVAVQAGREAAFERRVELQSEVESVTEPKPSM
jgi:gas vesicle protein